MVMALLVVVLAAECVESVTGAAMLSQLKPTLAVTASPTPNQGMLPNLRRMFLCLLHVMDWQFGIHGHVPRL
jgi:Spy/CpxP family protein refolding chaperone